MFDIVNFFYDESSSNHDTCVHSTEFFLHNSSRLNCRRMQMTCCNGGYYTVTMSAITFLQCKLIRLVCSSCELSCLTNLPRFVIEEFDITGPFKIQESGQNYLKKFFIFISEKYNLINIFFFVKFVNNQWPKCIHKKQYQYIKMK